MAQREHRIGNDVRITASTERFWAFFHQSWGASIRREIRVSGAQWWNPVSWFTGDRWESRGDVGPFDVRFLAGNGDDITNRLAPSLTTSPGLRRVSVSFSQIGWSGGNLPGGAGLDDLGTDARAVDNVEMTYGVDGEQFRLVHHG